MKLRRFIKWTIFLFWLALIFFLSHQSGEESLNLSGHFTSMIESIFSAPWLSNFVIDITYLVRKSAHFWIYFFLGIFTISLFSEYFSNGKLILFSLLFCILYASSDEIHQLFIPARSGKIWDVLLDSGGSFLGIFISSIFLKFFKKKRQEN